MLDRREFVRVCGLSAFANLAASSLFAQDHNFQSISLEDSIREALIIGKSRLPPTEPEFRPLDIVPKSPFDLTLSSTRETSLKRVAGLAYINFTLQNLNVTEEDRKHALANLRKIVVEDQRSNFDPEIRVGIEDALGKIAELNRHKFQAGAGSIGDIIGLGGMTLALTTKGLGPYILTTFGLLTSRSAKLVTFNESSIQEQAAVQEVGDLLVRHLSTIYKSDPKARNILDNPLINHGLNLDFKPTTEELIDYAPPKLAIGLKKAIESEKKGSTFSSKEQEQLAISVLSEINKSYDKFRVSLVDEIIARQQKREDDARKEETKRIYTNNEIHSGAYLIGTLGSMIFNDKSIEVVVNTVAESYQKLSNLMENLTIGTAGALTGVGTVVSVGLALSSLYNSFSSPEEDPVLMALSQLQKSINTLRTEMHERFDQIVDNQKIIIMGLHDLLEVTLKGNRKTAIKLEDLHIQIAEIEKRLVNLDDYLRSQERSKASFDFNTQLKVVETEFADRKRGSGYDCNAVQRALEKLALYATDVALSPAYTGNEVGIEWDASRIRNNLGSQISLDLVVGNLNAIHQKAIGLPIAASNPRNPLVVARGINAYAMVAIRAPEPEVMNSALKMEFDNLADVVDETQSFLKQALDPAVITSLKNKYEVLFDRILQSALNVALQPLLVKPQSDGLPANAKSGKIYPFGSPNWTASSELSFKKVRFNSPSNTGLKRFRSHAENSVDGAPVNIFQCYRDKNDVSNSLEISTKTDILTLAQTYGIISLRKFISGTRSIDPKHAQIGADHYHVMFLQGTLKGKSGLCFSSREVPIVGPSTTSTTKDGTTVIPSPPKDPETRENPALTAQESWLRKQTPVNICVFYDPKETSGREMFPKNADPIASSFDKSSLDCNPFNHAGITINSTEQLLQILFKDVRECHERRREEFIKEFKTDLEVTHNQECTEYEGLAQSLTYLAGVKEWLAGENIGICTWLAKTPSAILGTREDLIKQLKALINPKNEPKRQTSSESEVQLDINDPNFKEERRRRSLPDANALDVSIYEWALVKMRERFQENLSLFFAAHLPVVEGKELSIRDLNSAKAAIASAKAIFK